MNHSNHPWRAAWLCGGFVLTACWPTRAQTIIYVRASAAPGGDGASWATAFNDVQVALSAAMPDAQIWVAQGTYRAAPPDGDRALSFALKNGVGLYGGFAGSETTLAERNPALHTTTLSGDLNSNDSGDFVGNGENSYHVVTGHGCDATARIDGFTITGGNANGSEASANNLGGGLHALAGSPTLANCVLRENYALNHGAGGYANSGSPTFLTCTVQGNTAADDGGGLAFELSSPKVFNCSILGNHAEDGGGIVYSMSDPLIVNCRIIGNAASHQCGGVFCDASGSNGAIVNCTIAGNSASSAAGILCLATSPAIRNSIVWGNSPGGLSGSGTPVISYSDVQDPVPGIGNLQVDPLFVDLDGADDVIGTIDDNARLILNSPCVNTGDNAGIAPDAADLDGDSDTNEAVPFDLDSQPRVSGRAVDMGAFEWLSSSVLYVRADAPPGGTGLGWGTAFNDLQLALAAAIPGTQVWVAAGTYHPTSAGGDPTISFQLASGVALYGGFEGNETLISERDPAQHETILSGDLNDDDQPGFVNDTENSHHVVRATNVDSSARLDGFTVTGGHANAPLGLPDVHGAGMVMINASPVVADCTIRGNRSAYSGGGVYADLGASPTFLRCVIQGNVAEDNGGGLDVEQNQPGLPAGTPVIDACLVLGNQAEDGGGIVYHKCNPTIRNTRVIGNTATDIAGGIFCDNSGSDGLITNCTIVDNTALFGGAIFCWANSPTVTNCVLRSPSASRVHTNSGGNPTITYSNVEGNWTGPGGDNIDLDPVLTLDAHLSAGSPCIDAGDPDFVAEAGATDFEGDPRVANGRVDMGADEYLDSDGDGLPDGWEGQYFASATAAEPGNDADGDGLSNLAEYRDYLTNPAAPPLYVDAETGSDANDGLSPDPQGGGVGPKQTIQAAIDTVGAGGTVMVLPGTYAGAGNRELDYHGRTLVVRSTDGPAVTTIVCGSAGRAVNFETIRGLHAALEGFTVTRATTLDESGGALRAELTRVRFTNCIFTGNASTSGAEDLYLDQTRATLGGMSFPLGASSDAVRAIVSRSIITLHNELLLESGQLQLRSSTLGGPGDLMLADGTTLRVGGSSPGSPGSVIRSNILGLGDMQLT